MEALHLLDTAWCRPSGHHGHLPGLGWFDDLLIQHPLQFVPVDGYPAWPLPTWGSPFHINAVLDARGASEHLPGLVKKPS